MHFVRYLPLIPRKLPIIFCNFFLILPSDTPLLILMAFWKMNEYARTTMDETAWRQRADAGDSDSRWKFGRIKGE
jgi:hypothetical protein